MSMTIDSARVRAERLKRAWSQEQLAHVAGLGLRTVHRIEKSGRGSLESLKSLAAVFELLPEDLMTKQDESEPGVGTVIKKEVAEQPDDIQAARKLQLFFVQQVHAFFYSARKFVTGGIFGAFLTTFSFMMADSVAASQVSLDLKGTITKMVSETTKSSKTVEFDLVLEDGKKAVVELNEFLKLELTPTIVDSEVVMLRSAVYSWENNEFTLISEPSLLAMDKENAVISLALDDSQKTLELSLTPEIH